MRHKKKKAALMALTLILSAVLTVKAAKLHGVYQLYHGQGRFISRLLGNRSGGTGFQVIDAGGNQYTVTNDHVCSLADKDGIMMAVPTFGDTQLVKVIARSERTDLCILTPVHEKGGFHIGKLDAKLGEHIRILGHPLLGTLTVTDGRIIKNEPTEFIEGFIQSQDDVDKCVGKKRRIVDLFFGIVFGCVVHVDSQVTTVHIKPGNSGSPVLNDAGEVVGVAFAANKKDEAAIIPLKDLARFLRDVSKALKQRRLRKVFEYN